MTTELALRRLIGFEVQYQTDETGVAHGQGNVTTTLTRAPSPTFDEVYRRTWRFVRRSALRLGVGRSAVEDIVQDVFVTVHRRLADFHGRSTLETWVFGILERMIQNHRRTLRRKGAGQATWSAVSDPDQLIDGAAGPLELLARREVARTVERTLCTLGQRKAMVFVLCEVEGFSVPEIARATGIKLRTVYSRRKSARSAVRRALAPACDVR